MSLSIILLIIAPIFGIPLFLLPDNKIRIFSFSFITGFSLVVALIVLDIIYNQFAIRIAKGIYPAVGWFFNNNKELSINEKYRIIFSFVQILAFLLGTIISYVTFNTIYIGKNPSISKKNNQVLNAFWRVIMFFISYLPVCYFLICIRGVSSLSDGFMKPLFNLIYYIGA